MSHFPRLRALALFGRRPPECEERLVIAGVQKTCTGAVVAHTLGEQQLAEYALEFGFGNANFSGDPGKHNGLNRAWISSSLKVSPFEQTVFLRRLVMHQLPVSERAMIEASKIVEVSPVGDGWEAHGKTGATYPKKPDGALDEARGFGWYVGWAVKDGWTLIFARLSQDERKEATPGGIRARDALLESWPMLVTSLPR